MAQVELKKVQKIYPNGFQAVYDFDLAINDGEFMVFVGPSGCGKSTTLRMVAGLEEISGGELIIADKIMNNVQPKDRNIAMVFQNYALYPHMTVYKNMAFGLKLRRMPKAEIDRRVKDAAKILGIENLLERKPKQLSGGQRQRVAVGRAIVRDPHCFLFDEPLSNLDAKLRVEMRAELKALHHRLKTTTIYVTHDQEEAMTLGDRICVMKLGYIQQVATPLQMYWHPVNHFVAGFVGTPPMNFLDGIIEAEGDDLYFVEGKFTREDPEKEESKITAFDKGTNRIKVPAWAKSSMADQVGKYSVMGVRPENFSLHPDERFGGEGASLEMKIRVFETLGEKMDVFHYTPYTQKVVARLNATSGIAADKDVTLYMDLNRIHFFEAEGQMKNLALEAEQEHIATLGLMAV